MRDIVPVELSSQDWLHCIISFRDSRVLCGMPCVAYYGSYSLTVLRNGRPLQKVDHKNVFLITLRTESPAVTLTPASFSTYAAKPSSLHNLVRGNTSQTSACLTWFVIRCRLLLSSISHQTSSRMLQGLCTHPHSASPSNHPRSSSTTVQPCHRRLAFRQAP